jgi:hypothetical protein
MLNVLTAPSILKLLSSLTFWDMFDHSSYSKNIKMIIYFDMIRFITKENWINVDNNLRTEGVYSMKCALFGNLYGQFCWFWLVYPCYLTMDWCEMYFWVLSSLILLIVHMEISAPTYILDFLNDEAYNWVVSFERLLHHRLGCFSMISSHDWWDDHIIRLYSTLLLLRDEMVSPWIKLISGISSKSQLVCSPYGSLTKILKSGDLVLS